MGLKRATFEKIAGAAFKAVGELRVTATLRRTASVYNPSTGAMVNTNTDYSVPVCLVGFSAYEIDRVLVNAFDRKGLLEAKDLPIEPMLATDTLIADGKTYNIIRWIKDPSGSVITLHLRAP